MNPTWLALSVQWDDCTAALGTADGCLALRSALPQSDDRAVAATPGAVASRDALALVDAVLAAAGLRGEQLSGLVVARGPGAFTALRVGVALIQGLGRAWHKPVRAIDSLAAMTALTDSDVDVQAPRDWLQVCALDARMGELYFAVYRCRPGRFPETVLAPAVAPVLHALARIDAVLGGQSRPVRAAGQVFARVPELQAWIEQREPAVVLGRRGEPTAAELLAVAGRPDAPAAIDAGQVRPLYVRDKVALDSAEQRAAAAARAS